MVECGGGVYFGKQEWVFIVGDEGSGGDFQEDEGVFAEVSDDIKVLREWLEREDDNSWEELEVPGWRDQEEGMVWDWRFPVPKKLIITYLICLGFYVLKIRIILFMLDIYEYSIFDVIIAKFSI